VSFTQATEEALLHCRQVLELIEELQAVAGSRREDPSARLRITASASFAQTHLN